MVNPCFPYSRRKNVGDIMWLAACIVHLQIPYRLNQNRTRIKFFKISIRRANSVYFVLIFISNKRTIETSLWAASIDLVFCCTCCLFSALFLFFFFFCRVWCGMSCAVWSGLYIHLYTPIGLEAHLLRSSQSFYWPQNWVLVTCLCTESFCFVFTCLLFLPLLWIL